MGLTQSCPFLSTALSDSQFLLPSVILKSEFPLVGVLCYGLITTVTDDERSDDEVNLAILEYYCRTRIIHVDLF